jgi:hypothetical protein
MGWVVVPGTRVRALISSLETDDFGTSLFEVRRHAVRKPQ